MLDEIMSSFAKSKAVPLQRTTDGDKEYLAQRWIEARLREVAPSFVDRGRNAYPDFVLPTISVESKSLSIRGGKPARKDFDFNSSLPSGSFGDKPLYFSNLFYCPDALSVHTLSFVHGSFYNDDASLKTSSEPIREYGSYRDGYVRVRHMYVFRHAVSLVPEVLGKVTAIVPSSNVLNGKLIKNVTRGDNSFSVYEY